MNKHELLGLILSGARLGGSVTKDRGRDETRLPPPVQTQICMCPIFKMINPAIICYRKYILSSSLEEGFPHSSVGKESACNVGDPTGLIPRLGRSAGEGIGYPLHDSWASVMAWLVKNLSAVRESWVWSLSWKDPLEKQKATHSSILAWRIPWTI